MTYSRERNRDFIDYAVPTVGAGLGAAGAIYGGQMGRARYDRGVYASKRVGSPNRVKGKDGDWVVGVKNKKYNPLNRAVGVVTREDIPEYIPKVAKSGNFKGDEIGVNRGAMLASLRKKAASDKYGKMNARNYLSKDYDAASGYARNIYKQATRPSGSIGRRIERTWGALKGSGKGAALRLGGLGLAGGIGGAYLSSAGNRALRNAGYY